MADEKKKPDEEAEEDQTKHPSANKFNIVEGSVSWEPPKWMRKQEDKEKKDAD